VDYDLNTISGDNVDGGGIPHGRLLVEFAEAVLDVDADAGRLINARAAIVDAMGAAALVDSAAVAGLFNAIDRVADSTGIPLEEDKAEVSADLRDELGINEFASMKAS
jgi:alcohol dehydrogenase class IV